jgi:hypothetical protein
MLPFLNRPHVIKNICFNTYVGVKFALNFGTLFVFEKINTFVIRVKIIFIEEN